MRFQSYAGLGIQSADTPEYRFLFEYLGEKRKVALEATYAERAKVLLEEMIQDPELFVRRVCVSNSADSIYPRVPLFAVVDVRQFVDLVLSQKAHAQDTILGAFKTRYDFVPVDHELTNEIPWVHALKDELLARAESMSPLNKIRTETFVKWYLAEIPTPKILD